eukprot:m.198714 g.198714  ORF g.198714 m.198714 type:complete len:70 (+) comp16837_c0_seq2:262-471(+)
MLSIKHLQINKLHEQLNAVSPEQLEHLYKNIKAIQLFLHYPEVGATSTKREQNAVTLFLFSAWLRSHGT